MMLLGALVLTSLSCSMDVLTPYWPFCSFLPPLFVDMPAKAMLFDIKCNGKVEFPVGSKNHVRWNPQGSLVCFGGFGNLPGHVEIWSRSEAIRRVGHFQSQGAAICEWSPDGAHLITSILTPRLRVDNGFKLWNWRGTFLHSTPYGELYQATWRPQDPASFPAVDVSEVPLTASGPISTDSTAKKAVYRPPGLRNSAESSAKTGAGSKAGSVTAPATISKEERQFRRLKEKLDQVAVLRERQSKGEALEQNQLEKIQREDEYRKEYEKALVALGKL